MVDSLSSISFCRIFKLPLSETFFALPELDQMTRDFKALQTDASILTHYMINKHGFLWKC